MVVRFQMPVESLVRVLDIEAPHQTGIAQDPQGVIDRSLGQGGHLRLQAGVNRIHGGMVVMMAEVAQHGKALHRGPQAGFQQPPAQFHRSNILVLLRLHLYFVTITTLKQLQIYKDFRKYQAETKKTAGSPLRNPAVFHPTYP